MSVKAIGKKAPAYHVQASQNKKMKKSSPQIHQEILCQLFKELSQNELRLEQNQLIARSHTPFDKLVEAIKKDDAHAIKILIKQAIDDGVDIADLNDVVMDYISSTRYAHGCKTFERITKIALIKLAIVNQNFDSLDSSFAHRTKMRNESVKTVFEAIDELMVENAEMRSLLSIIKSEMLAILQIEKKRHQLEPLDLLNICLKIEDAFLSHQDSGALYLRRSESKLPRAVIIDFQNHEFTILSKKFGALRAEGAFKRVSDAIHVQFSEKGCDAKRMVRAVNKFEKKIYNSELDFEREYGNNLYIISYPAKRDPSVTKTNLIQEPYDSDLYVFTANVTKNDRGELTFPELLDVMEGIGESLSAMHNRGHVHRDLKAKNVLIRRNPDKTVSVKLCDYGHANQPLNEVVSNHNPKVHGTLRYTPPEVLEGRMRSFNPLEQQKAVDMYGLGCLLYELVTQERTNWGHDVWKALKGSQRAIKKAVEQQKKVAHDLLEQNMPPHDSYKKELLWITALLLSDNPRTRMNVDEFLIAIKALKLKLG